MDAQNSNQETFQRELVQTFRERGLFLDSTVRNLLLPFMTGSSMDQNIPVDNTKTAESRTEEYQSNTPNTVCLKGLYTLLAELRGQQEQMVKNIRQLKSEICREKEAMNATVAKKEQLHQLIGQAKEHGVDWLYVLKN